MIAAQSKEQWTYQTTFFLRLQRHTTRWLRACFELLICVRTQLVAMEILSSTQALWSRTLIGAKDQLGGKYIHYTIIWWYEVFIDIQNNERWGTCWQTKSECRSLRLSWNTKWRLHSFLKFIFPGSLFSSKLRLQIFFNTSLATFRASCSLFASVFLHYQTYLTMKF